MTTNETFDGLAFPVAKVRLNGATDTRGARYSATVYRDRDRTYRATAPYDHGIGGGARGALPAALKAFERALAENDPPASAIGDYVAVPGDFSQDLYVFTFVPRSFF
jgi:hypothetical protein